MGKAVQPKIKILPKNFDRDAEAILARIQPELLPDQADKSVSINVTMGEYVLGDTLRESTRAFHERWPDELFYQVRADGGPVMRLSWAHTYRTSESGRRQSATAADLPLSGRGASGRILNSDAITTRSGDMGKTALPKIKILPKDFDRKAEAILARIQPELLPEQAAKIVSINVTSGEYVLADTLRESGRAFRERWPDEVAFQVRAEGGPVMRVPWV